MKRHALLIALAVALVPASASAFTLVDKDDMKLTLGGLGRLGYVMASDGGEFTQAPYIQMARIAAGFTHERYGGAAVQFEGASGDVGMIDAFVQLTPVEEVALRAGRYRLPTTQDFLVGAPGIPFSNRSMLVSMYNSRMNGVEIDSTLASETLAVNVRLGFFQAEADERALLPDGEGNFFSARAGLDLDFGLSFHVAYLALVLADNAPVVPPDDPMAPAIRPVTFPEAVDAAITFKRDGWWASVEGLVAPDVEDGEDIPWAAYGFLVYRFGISEVVDLAPGLRYGIISQGGVETQRITAGVTTFFGESGLKLLPNYELSLTDGDAGHTGYVTLQGHF